MDTTVGKYSDQELLTRVKSIYNPGFKRLLEEAQKCATHRRKKLVFLICPDIPRVCVTDEHIQIYLRRDVSHSTLKHDAAHELCHVLAGCCGFSYEIIISENLNKRLDNGSRIDAEWSVLELSSVLGDFLTHIAIHKLLQAAGYSDRNWDVFLIKQAQKSTDSVDLGFEVRNIGFVIQYEELEKMNIPALDVETLKNEYKRLIPTFDADYNIVRSSVVIKDLLDIDGCLESTKSLCRAFGKLIEYPIEKDITIKIACRPETDEWSLLTVVQRLQTVK